ncbi:cupin domain-containing protein [Amycolatopsis sp., V23-08]|uniref:Cupin domain-containing protein n=1 Tax=Amycolatopsis heterodermiae TaxID=3110235 RepID=A0ABU5R491_9PSEU|nr:cupin domain-containing protein [Amycolatopsis sp., V23-08]MEA5361033.1 cupin domain-containing protein [Amycolatopsis sp., V23-08]
MPAGAPPHGKVLPRLVGPDVDAFAARHWGCAPLLRRAADGDAFRDLFDLDGADELLSRRGLRTPFLRLARHGEVVDSRAFTGGAGAGAEIGDQVQDEKVAALFADGATIVLQALHRTWPALVDFAVGLTGELGHPVQANAYITPPSSQGFSAHYDVHDVFVLQLAGRKHWSVHSPVHPAPLRTQPWSTHAEAVAARARDTPAVDAVLEPGDLMYLPRGWLHSATALGDVSAHLTIGVHVVTRFAVVEALAALVAADERLRASLPLGIDVADPGQVADHLGPVREVLIEALAGVPAEAVARHLRDRAWPGGRPEPLRPIASAAFARDLAAGDTVRRRAGLRHRVENTDDGRTVLELADRRITLPGTTSTAVRALLDGQTWRIGAIPGLGEPDQLVLVRRLLREGVLVAASA